MRLINAVATPSSTNCGPCDITNVNGFVDVGDDGGGPDDDDDDVTTARPALDGIQRLLKYFTRS